MSFFISICSGGKRSFSLKGFLVSVVIPCSLAAGLVSGCGGASTDQIQLLRSEIFTLKQEQRQLHHQASTLDSLVRRKTDQRSQFGAGFGADIRQLQERLSVLEQRMDDTEARITRLKSTAATSSPAASAARSEGTQAVRIAPREIFDLAYKDFTSSNYEMAVEGFRDFLQRFPDSPLAPEAHLYIGNSFRARKKYEEAVSSYRTLVDRYPDSPLQPDALYRIGDCLLKLGDRSRGETYFQTVIQKFPDSNAAALARAKMNP
ncbi:MAG: tol-pal system protein YbgF [Gemmatimonadota bacterium]|nr:tol-pal system protein YbgF [Gemmatimonadota bacterium]